MKSRADLDAELFALHASLPLWRDRVSSDDDLLATYSSLFERVLDTTAPPDRDYAIEHLNEIAASAGLVGVSVRADCRSHA